MHLCARMFGDPRDRMVDITVEELVTQRFGNNLEGWRKRLL